MSEAHSTDRQLLDMFEAFCEQAKPALEQAKPKPPADGFRRFLKAAEPLLLDSVSARLPAIQEALRDLKPWLLDELLDILDVARVTASEDPYTELIAWAISPSVNSELAVACQRAWLGALGVEEAVVNDPVDPMTQFSTDSGIPDLVLAYQNLLVIVEAKTRSEEHKASNTRLMQTKAYPSAVRRRLNKSDDFPTAMVFLK